MRSFLLAVCWYIVPGVVWIVGADAAIGIVVSDPELVSRLSLASALAFVLVGGLFVYWLLARQQSVQADVQAAYLETERGFRLLFQNSPLPTWAYDRETLLFLEINDVALARYGYRRDELLGMKVTDLHPPDEVSPLLDAIATPRAVREVSGVWRHRLKDGRLIEVEVQVHDLDLRGRPARIVVALDVTERQQTLRAEQRHAERARLLADVALATSVAGTVANVLHEVTAAARTIIGARQARTTYAAVPTGADVIVATSPYDAKARERGVHSPLDDAEVRRRLRDELRPIRLTGPDLERAGGGQLAVGSWMAAPLVSRDGTMLGVVEIADRVEGDPPADFTDEDEAILVQLAQMGSVAAENALLLQERLERERRFRELVDGLDAIVWEADPHSLHFGYVSQNAETVLGYPLAAWMANADALARWTSPEDCQRVREYLVGIAEGLTSIPCEVRVRTADGRSVWLRIEGAAHADEEGRITRLRGLITDVTGERERDERVARGEKLRALGQMSSGVAHDLNQSLALIAGYGELLQHALDEQPLPLDRLREMTDVMVRAASDGGETVRRLLSFVRTSRDESEPLVDVAHVLYEVVQLTAPRWRDASQAEGRPIEMTVEVEGDIRLPGSASALREALTNLVLNAVDALPEGGTIELGAKVKGDRALITVSDSGVGMSEEVRARIFEPFFTTKGDRGTGLGLPTVFGIVEAHGGELSVHSEPGQGATFELSFPGLPREREPTAVVTPATPTSAAHSAGLRCLVVDDEPQLARMLATMLDRLGHSAITASSGEAALELLEAEPVDLLVTDVGMGPSMNGWELVERARGRYPDLQMMLATGWGASITPEQARAHGLLAVLSKPYRQADLRRVLALVPRHAVSPS
ncbi:MAG: PAS domain S-box protein [Chloroflexota bacterium]